MDIKWQEPPTSRKGTKPASERTRLIEQLKKHPGRWALVEEKCPRNSASTNWKKRGCEATSRKRPDGNGYDIYARWPEPDLGEVDPYIASRRARGVPEGGAAPHIRRVS